MPVGELLARISSRELTEWQAFFALESEEAERDRLAAKAEAGVAARAHRPRRR